MGKKSGITFQKLLDTLDPNHERAAEMYLELCFKIRKFIAWKGGVRESYIDELVDETVDRIEKKLGNREVIENINAYALGVARYVWHEHLRKQPEEPIKDAGAEISIAAATEELDGRHECLRKCLENLKPDERTQILSYYDVERHEKKKDKRKELAARFGKSSGALKVQATRLRDKLRKCIGDCMRNEK